MDGIQTLSTVIAHLTASVEVEIENNNSGGGDSSQLLVYLAAVAVGGVVLLVALPLCVVLAGYFILKRNSKNTGTSECMEEFAMVTNFQYRKAEMELNYLEVRVY